mmetsp:Transcript_19301/g.38915  ORF Transcript_19301/g.38915 Transcript_19301/m.38915 type:complete len:80 (-) Transcript_19301:137-376(-)
MHSFIHVSDCSFRFFPPSLPFSIDRIEFEARKETTAYKHQHVDCMDMIFHPSMNLSVSLCAPLVDESRPCMSAHEKKAI